MCPPPKTEVPLSIEAHLSDVEMTESALFASRLRNKDPSVRGKLCPDLAEFGTCANMLTTCDYSHTIEEARGYNQFFKTKVCGFAAKGHCIKGSKCRYAHSMSELDTVGSEDMSPITSGTRIGDESIGFPHLPLRTISTAMTEPETPTLLSPMASATRKIDMANFSQTSSAAAALIGEQAIRKLARSTSAVFGGNKNKLNKTKTCSQRVNHKVSHRYSSGNSHVPSSFHYVDNLKYVVPPTMAAGTTGAPAYYYYGHPGQTTAHLMYAPPPHMVPHYMYDPTFAAQTMMATGYVQYED